MPTQLLTKNLLESKRIVQLFANLPDEQLLLFAKTTDQVGHWLLNRLTWTMVACAWRARMNGEDDPLRPLVRSRELCQNDYNRIWQLVECYERLWALVQLTEPFIKDDFERFKLPYSFSSSYDLFVCIVQEQGNGQFAYCLHPYKEFSAKKRILKFRGLATRIREEFPTPKVAQTSVPANFINSVKHIFWSLLLLSTAYHKASKSKHRALRKALESYNASIADLFELEASFARRTGSFRWVDGKKQKGSRHGGTYEEKP